MTGKSTDPGRDTNQDAPPNHDERILDSDDLFQGRRVVVIRHGDVNYRLLQTKNGKLILQK